MRKAFSSAIGVALVRRVWAISIVAADTGWPQPMQQAVMPQRSAFATDTSTAAAGDFELEAGVVFDESRSIDSPISLRLGVSSFMELYLDLSPVVRLASPAGSATGFGDLVMGGRLRFLDQNPSWPEAAVQLAAKLPTADEEKNIGSGSFDWFAGVALTRSVDSVTLVGFYDLGALGQSEGAFDLQHGLAMALAFPVWNSLEGFMELASVRVPDQGQETLFSTFGLGYSLRTNWVVDAAIIAGLSGDTPDFAATLGFTNNLGSVWR